MSQACKKGFFHLYLAAVCLLLFVTLGCQPTYGGVAPAEETTLEEVTREEVVSTEATVTIEGFAFNPREVRIKAGGTVTWQQKDSAPHTVTSDNEEFDSGSLSQGDNWSFTFEKPGTYEYYCKIHPSMKARISVGAFACKKDERPEGRQAKPIEKDDQKITLPDNIKDLNMPTDMAFAKDGTLYFTEKSGALRVVEEGRLKPEPLLKINVPDILGYNETGLLGLALSPDFDKDNLIYLYHSYEKNGQLFNRVISINAKDPQAGKRIILDKILGGRTHNGGKLEFGPDGNLFISTGETGVPELSRKVPGLNGKILRVTREGKIPPDNPIIDPYGKPSEVYAFGLRNVFGIAFDDKGRLFATENGSEDDDEINLIKPGADYGWPTVTGDEGGGHFEAPLITYKEAIAPTEIIFYTGQSLPEIKDHLLFGDFNNGYLYKLTLKDNKASSDIVHSAGKPIIAIAQSPDGALYIATDDQIQHLKKLVE